MNEIDILRGFLVHTPAFISAQTSHYLFINKIGPNADDNFDLLDLISWVSQK